MTTNEIQPCQLHEIRHGNERTVTKAMNATTLHWSFLATEQCKMFEPVLLNITLSKKRLLHLSRHWALPYSGCKWNCRLHRENIKQDKTITVFVVNTWRCYYLQMCSLTQGRNVLHSKLQLPVTPVRICWPCKFVGFSSSRPRLSWNDCDSPDKLDSESWKYRSSAVQSD